MTQETYEAGIESALALVGLEKTAFVPGLIGRLAPAARAGVKSVFGRGAVNAAKVAPKATGLADDAAQAAQPGMVSKAWNTAKTTVDDTLGITDKAKAVDQRLGITNKRRALSEGIETAGGKFDTGVSNFVGNRMGAPARQATEKMMKGTGAEMIRQTGGQAAAGAALEGGMNAAMAEEGQRGSAFLEGAGHGAASGAMFGAAMGGFGKPVANLRRSSMTQRAARQGLRGGAAAQAAKRQMGQSARTSLLGAVKPGKSTNPLGRGADIEDTIGGLGRIGAELALPLAIVPAIGMGSDGETIPQPQQAAPQQQTQFHQEYQPQTGAYGYPLYGEGTKTGSDQSECDVYGFTLYAEEKTAMVIGAAPVPGAVAAPEATEEAPLLSNESKGMLAGGGTGGILTNVTRDALLSRRKSPLKGAPGILANYVAPTVGSALGAAGGHSLAREYAPTPVAEDSIEEKLNQIDFDKLMRYYKKREADQA